MIATTRRQIKPHRNTPRPAGRFGAGLLRPSAPSYRLDCTIADLEWAQEALNAATTPEWDADTIDEQRALEFEWQDRLERGFVAL
jgi:hypothetical protein